MHRVFLRASLWVTVFAACALAVSSVQAQQDAVQPAPAAESAPATAPSLQPATAVRAPASANAPAPSPEPMPSPPAAAQTPLVPVAAPQVGPHTPNAGSPAKPKPPFLAKSFLLRAELGMGYGRAHGGEGPDGNGFIGGFTVSVGGFVVPRFALHADFSGMGTTTLHYKETDDFDKVSGTTSFWGYAGGGATAHVGDAGLLLSGGVGVSAVSAVEWSSIDADDGSYASTSKSEWSNPGFSFTLALAQQFRVGTPLGLGWAVRYYFAHYGQEGGDIVRLQEAHLLTLNFALTFNPQFHGGG